MSTADFVKNNPVLVGVVALGAIVVVWVAVKGVGGFAKDVTKGAVNAAGGAVEGTVVGLGELLAVPQTSKTECEKAIAEGRTLDASFACPAGKFVKSLFGG
ncbi:MAG TPA: hypothetical protein VIU93_02595 [Gallionellaceae bacterium]